jgi:hypothetical protein
MIFLLLIFASGAVHLVGCDAVLSAVDTYHACLPPHQQQVDLLRSVS